MPEETKFTVDYWYSDHDRGAHEFTLVELKEVLNALGIENIMLKDIEQILIRRQ